MVVEMVAIDFSRQSLRLCCDSRGVLELYQATSLTFHASFNLTSKDFVIRPSSADFGVRQLQCYWQDNTLLAYCSVFDQWS